MSTLGVWTLDDAARAWRIKRRTALAWFSQGRVPSASRIGREWVCPAGTEKPPVPGRGRPRKVEKGRIEVGKERTASKPRPGTGPKAEGRT